VVMAWMPNFEAPAMSLAVDPYVEGTVRFLRAHLPYIEAFRLVFAVSLTHYGVLTNVAFAGLRKPLFSDRITLFPGPFLSRFECTLEGAIGPFRRRKEDHFRMAKLRV
jgi:hypothetical protein